MKFKRNHLIIILIALVAKIIFHFFWDFYYTYDHNRNLLVMEDLVNYGTLAYYGRNFVTSPPLYFLTYSFAGLLIGVSHFSIQFLELITYFAASLLVGRILFKISGSRKTALIGFLITFLNPTALLVEDLDFIAINLLTASILVLGYFKFIKSQGLRSSLILGLALGLSLLVKDSFFLLACLIIIHYLLFIRKKLAYLLVVLVIALIIYSPWLIYLQVNDLPFPWESHEGELTGNLEWADYQVKPLTEGYAILFNNWPLMFILSILYCFNKSKAKEVNFFKFLLVAGPLFTRLILSYFVLDHVYFLFISLPVLSTLIISAESFKLDLYRLDLKINARNLLVLLLAASLLVNNYLIIVNEGSFLHDNCSLFAYLKGLTKSDVVLEANVEVLGYTDFELMSDAKFEHTMTADLNFLTTMILANDANLLVSGTRLNYPFLKLTKSFNCNIRGVNANYYVYDISKGEANYSLSFKVVGDNKPLANAFIRLLFGNKSYYFLTKNDGTCSISVIERPLMARIYRVGYEPKMIIEPKGDLTVNLNKLPFYLTGYNHTRY